MSWKDRILPPSLDGIPFSIGSHSARFGRGLVEHRYVNSDKTTVDDVGRDPRKLSIEGYVVGEDYDEIRNRLIRAVETPGWKTLDHPYLGRMDVYPQSMQISEDKAKGRMFSFSLTVLERLIIVDEVEVRAPIQDVQGIFTRMVQTTQDRIPKELSAIDQVFAAADQAIALAGRIRQVVAAAVERVVAFISKFAAFQDLADQMLALATDIAGGVFEIYGTIKSLFENAVAFIGNVKDAIGFYTGLFRVEDSTIPGDGAYSTRQRTQENALIGSVRTLAFAGLCRSFVLDRYHDQESALARRDQIAGLAAELLDGSPHPNSDVNLIRSILRSTVDAMNRLGASLPAVYRYEEPGTTGLKMAYRFYGSVEREAELLGLNKIGNPLFVRGPMVVRVG